MKKINAAFCAILVLLSLQLATAQPGKARGNANANPEKGEALYAKGAFAQAAVAFASVVETNPNDVVTRSKLAEIYLKLNDYKRAAQQFKVFYESEEKDVQLNYPNAALYYAIALRQLGNHETAKTVLTRYIEKNKTNTDLSSATLLAQAKVEREGCDLAMSNYSNMKAEVQNLGTNLNGVYNEAAVSYAAPDKILYTCVPTNSPVAIADSRRTFAKLYTATLDGTVWKNETPLPEVINSPTANNANACFSVDGKRIYFTRCTENATGKMQCDLFLSQLTPEGAFGTPVKLEEELNAPGSSTTMPFVIDAGRGDDLLYFASTRKGGKGGYDIWSVVRHPEGTYDKLQNIADINTPLDELSPFLDKESIFFFSSNGHPGFGGYDVFSYQVVEQEPIVKNAGKPINSPADDLYFTTNNTGLTGFLVSNRVGAKPIDETNPTGSDDIFTVKIDRKKPIKDKITPPPPVEVVAIGKEVRKDIIVETAPKVETPIEKIPEKTPEKVVEKTPVAIETPKETPPTTINVAGSNYKNPKRNVSADACARASLYDVTNGTALTVRDIPCANENNIDFALAPNKKYIFVLECAGEILQSREISTLSSRKSEIFHPYLNNREITVAPPTPNAVVTSNTQEKPIEIKTPLATSKKEETFNLKGGLVVDGGTTANQGDLRGAIVTLYRLDNETSATELNRKTITDDNSYSFEVKQGTPYRLVAEKAGFLKASVDFTADKNNTAIANLVLRTKKANLVFKINNIYYEINSATVTPESSVELANLLTLLNDNQTTIVEISSHTDNVGTTIANQTLSQRRAQSVVDYLTTRGVSAARLRAKGYGATQPISENKTEAGRAKNRRTEFKIVGEIKEK